MSAKTSNQLQSYMGKIITQAGFFYDACLFQIWIEDMCDSKFTDLKGHYWMSFQSFV